MSDVINLADARLRVRTLAAVSRTGDRGVNPALLVIERPNDAGKTTTTKASG